jgi:hypothetical protein
MLSGVVQIPIRAGQALARIFHTPLEIESHCRRRREESFRKNTNEQRTHVVSCNLAG